MPPGQHPGNPYGGQYPPGHPGHPSMAQRHPGPPMGMGGGPPGSCPAPGPMKPGMGMYARRPSPYPTNPYLAKRPMYSNGQMEVSRLFKQIFDFFLCTPTYSII